MGKEIMAILKDVDGLIEEVGGIPESFSEMFDGIATGMVTAPNGERPGAEDARALFRATLDLAYCLGFRDGGHRAYDVSTDLIKLKMSTVGKT